MPELSEDDDPPKPVRRRRGSAAVLALIIVGVLAVAGGAAGLARALTRPATPAQAAVAARAEVASRWERLPAGQIFPARLGYVDVDQSRQYLTRAGIAPRAGCARAADPAVAQVLDRAGCTTMLRATYVDASGTLAVTVGVAVMTSPAAALRVGQAVSTTGYTGLAAYPVPGTAASRFGNAQRQLFGLSLAGHGPYLILDTGGFTDGRPRAGSPGPPLTNLLSSLLSDSALPAILTQTQQNPCRQGDIRC
jgi:hypothetical protein